MITESNSEIKWFSVTCNCIGKLHQVQNLDCINFKIMKLLHRKASISYIHNTQQPLHSKQKLIVFNFILTVVIKGADKHYFTRITIMENVLLHCDCLLRALMLGVPIYLIAYMSLKKNMI